MSKSDISVHVQFYLDSEGHGVELVLKHDEPDNIASYLVGPTGLGLRVEGVNANLAASAFNVGWVAIEAAEFFGRSVVTVHRVTREGEPMRVGGVNLYPTVTRTRSAELIADQVVGMVVDSICTQS